MSAGKVMSKVEMDAIVATHPAELVQLFTRIMRMKDWLDGQTNNDLIALGYVQSDVDRIKSAYSDLAALKTTYDTTRSSFTKLLMGPGPV